MANKRRDYTPAEQLAFATEVGGHCPCCDTPLFYTKNGGRWKDYDLAHIYPLNPTEAEAQLLAGVERLCDDPNAPENIIALCTRCHGRFDKPRTVEEYNELLRLKRVFLARSAQKLLNHQYPLEEDIHILIDWLHASPADPSESSELVLDAKRLDEKLPETIPYPTKRKIHNAVEDYYLRIKLLFQEIERDAPSTAELMLSQVRTYYLKQLSLGHSPAVIFDNIVEWLASGSRPPKRDAAEALASFFVQNCEVFE